MPTIYTGKKRIQETPKQQKVKVKDLDKSEFDARVMKAVQAANPKPTGTGGETYSPAGGPNAPRGLTPEQIAEMKKREASFPSEIIQGFPSGEYGETLGTAAMLEAESKIPADMQLMGLVPSTNRIVPGEPTEYEKFSAILANFKSVPLLGSALGAIKQENRLSELSNMITNIEAGIESGRITYENIQREIRDMKIEFVKEDQRIQLEAKFDVSKLFSGKQTQAELDIQNLKDDLLDMEANAAKRLGELAVQKVIAGRGQSQDKRGALLQ